MAICQIDPPEEGFHVKTIGNKLKQYNGDAILFVSSPLLSPRPFYLLSFPSESSRIDRTAS
jgi:hypothetical protein